MNRRTFLKTTAKGAGLLLAGGFPFHSLAAGNVHRLVILHTNDTHSRLDPFPDDSPQHAGKGGIAARAAVISQIRAEEEHVLLFDSGDVFQGTPYFNFYKGEPEIKAMTRMQYDAMTMGNHDFDLGIEGFARQLPHASFPVLVANYDFKATELEHKTVPWKVFRKGGLKIGVFGIGIALDGLVEQRVYSRIGFLDPLQTANRIAHHLKHNEHCDMVICLSHLGFEYKQSRKISDTILAKESENIDLILGGHTHTFMDQPAMIPNKKGRMVVVNQAGWGGVVLGRLDYVFSDKKTTLSMNTQSVILGK